MALKNFILAGFGGQGILSFLFKICKLFYRFSIPIQNTNSKMGSYSCSSNCSVCISDEPIGSPLVLTPDILMAMNLQSYDKFIDTVAPGGFAAIDSTLVDKKCPREDITCVYVPATQLASDNNLQGLANIILIGTILKHTQFADFEAVKKAIDKCVPASKRHLVEANMRAIELGMQY